MTITTEAGTIRKNAMGWTITTPDAKFTSTVYLAKNGTDIIRASGTIVATITAEQVAAMSAPAPAKAPAHYPVAKGHHYNSAIGAMTRNGRGEFVPTDASEWEY